MRACGPPDAEHAAHHDEPGHRVPSVEDADEDDAPADRKADNDDKKAPARSWTSRPPPRTSASGWAASPFCPPAASRSDAASTPTRIPATAHRSICPDRTNP